MPLISLSGVKKTFAERLLFEDVSFDVSEKDRVGLVGVNGCGKTTLFRIIMGLEPIDSGSIYKSSELKVGVMNQSVENFDGTLYDYTLLEVSQLSALENEIEELNLEISSASPDELDKLIKKQDQKRERFEREGGLTYRARTRSVLLGLGFSDDEIKKELKHMSGGQKNKAQLARVLLSGANLLLLDEPTNHLDISSVTWLEDYILSMKCAVIVISHDRYFLDRVTNKTIELKNCRIKQTNGNYTRHIELCSTERELALRKYRKTQSEIRRIEGIVEQQKRWGRERNFITAASKQKEADRIKAQLVVPDSELETMRISFEPKCESGNDVLICRGLSKSFGEKHLFKNIDIHIRKGERVFILGANGCGKTTLFKILTGKCPQDSGEYDYGANVQVGYFDQMQQNLDLSKTAIDEVWDAFPNMTQTEVRSTMASFLFRGDEVFKPLSKMSGGERARISLLKLMLKGGNFLLLDEPTNHLDSSSREELEHTLKEYGGTLLIISHDRYFINKLADRVLVMTPDGVTEYLGNYDYYLERTKSEIGETKAEKTTTNKEKPQNDYFLQKQKQSEERKRKTRLNKAEAEIERLDGEIEKTQALISSEEVAADYEKLIELTNRLEQLRQEQEEQYLIWEELSE